MAWDGMGWGLKVVAQTTAVGVRGCGEPFSSCKWVPLCHRCRRSAAPTAAVDVLAVRRLHDSAHSSAAASPWTWALAFTKCDVLPPPPSHHHHHHLPHHGQGDLRPASGPRSGGAAPHARTVGSNPLENIAHAAATLEALLGVPPSYVPTSAVTGLGREAMLKYVSSLRQTFQMPLILR